MADNNLYVEEEFSTDNFPKSLRAAAFDFSLSLLVLVSTFFKALTTSLT